MIVVVRVVIWVPLRDEKGVEDRDRDGTRDATEASPVDLDTDNDGLPDGYEINYLLSEPDNQNSLSTSYLDREMMANIILSEINIENINNHIKILSGVNPYDFDGDGDEKNSDGTDEKINTRYQESSDITGAMNYIYNQLISYSGLSVEKQYYLWLYTKHDGYNIIATQKGSIDPENYYIIACHYDSYTTESDTNPEADAPGADDDATGVAAVLEIARILSKYKFTHTIKYIFFYGEEENEDGSGGYVRTYDQTNILGMIQLDQIGYTTGNNIITVDYIIESGDYSGKELYNKVDESNTKYQIGLTIKNTIGADRSDHKSFDKTKAIMIIEELNDYTHPSSAVPINPYSHTSDDTYAKSITGKEVYLSMMAKASLATITEISDDDGILLEYPYVLE